MNKWAVIIPLVAGIASFGNGYARQAYANQQQAQAASTPQRTWYFVDAKEKVCKPMATLAGGVLTPRALSASFTKYGWEITDTKSYGADDGQIVIMEIKSPKSEITTFVMSVDPVRCTAMRDYMRDAGRLVTNEELQ